MRQTQTVGYITQEEYEKGELHSEIRHEYIHGEVFAMAGASERHNRIAGNLFFQLRARARGGTCGVFVSDMKIRIRQGECFYYPDVALICDSEDKHEYHKDNPCMIAEVLSKTTKGTDYREKWHAYRDIPGLRYYLLVDSEYPHIEYYQRNLHGVWETGILESGEMLPISCPPAYKADLFFDDIYEDVNWA